MADTDLRTLERRAALGDPQAQARHLLQRMRVGELPLRRISLLAYLGEPGARAALGDEAPRPSAELETWARALAGWGREVAVRATVAATEAALAAPAGVAEPCLDAARAWLTCPCDAHARAARRTSRAAAIRNAGSTALQLLFSSAGPILAGPMTLASAPNVVEERALIATREARTAARLATTTVYADDYVSIAGLVARSARRARSSRHVRQAVTRVLLRWACVGEQPGRS